MDIKKQLTDIEAPFPSPPPAHVLYYSPPPTSESHTRRWGCVYRFILCLAGLAIVMHCVSSNRLSQLQQFYKKENGGKNEHLILHTGFPAIGVESDGLPILHNQGAAIAFSPNTAGFSLLTTNSDDNLSVQKESWWDRLFPWRHVHLHSVQLPVHSSKPIKARLAVCTSTRDSTLWQNFPDVSQCVSSATPLTVLDPQDDPGVLEWIAPGPNNAADGNENDAIVLRKKNVYWLVVQTEQDEFDWVYALPSEEYIGDTQIAYETQNGWKLEQDDNIPSIMITVVDH
ncbi:hypothetical protein BDC45DRAFT_497379 [Circinella umbellata]|nr:hypothetical protein BDC45DRAFT_497379 [Circinella umbellata]